MSKFEPMSLAPFQHRWLGDRGAWYLAGRRGGRGAALKELVGKEARSDEDREKLFADLDSRGYCLMDKDGGHVPAGVRDSFGVRAQ